HIANLSIIIRPDNGKYMIVERGGQIMISEGGLTGPYMIQGNSVYNTVNLPNLEDPVLWYSGGYYHIVVNSWSEKKAFHLRSKNGINNWTNQGLAFDPRSDFLRYTDGTVNHWCKIERPGVYIENGHITHWTFSVIDSEKEKDLGNDDHNSKVIVVPFDGASFDGEIVSEHRDTVYNGKFEAGTAGWTLNVWDGSATGTVVNGEYKTTISTAGTKSHDIQLVQAGLILQKDKFYRVTFDAYASANRTIDVNVEMKDDPWTSYLQNVKTFELTTTKVTYSFTFKMEPPTDSSGRLGFNCGASNETVFLDNISIQQVSESTSVIPTELRSNFTPFIKYRNASLQIVINSGSDAGISMGVFDLKGAAVLKSEINAVSTGACFNYNLSAIPKGIYLVALKSDGKLIHCSSFAHGN
ncbi:MAG TPA: carbohydrate binding domain-containing protein, partial [Chitinispirillaceae bacterium]|nr:carbohydrate binding domain-containing protein [Chitinispirillaceae bacterium]